MKIITIGSCLSDGISKRIASDFAGSKRLCNVVHHRSDQFYHYYIKKDRKKIPREFIEKSLKSIEHSRMHEPNYISLEVMLNNQYQYIGQYGNIEKNNFFETLANEEIDIFILDNNVDLSAILSYPKLNTYRDSPVFLRKGDFSNYNDFFTFGDKITIEDSIFYYQEIIKFLHKIQPSAAIYFVHFPYNTFSNNVQRQKRAKEFEEQFHSEIATIIPAPFIRKQYQIENDPAHFHNSTYVSLAGFIGSHYNIYFNKNKVEKLLNDGRKFNAPEEYYKIDEITFASEESWSAAIKIYEFENDQTFNFFFGKRGTCNLSILRRKNSLSFRTDDDSYIGDVEFLTKTLNEVVVTYDKGNFVFYNNGKMSNVIFHPSAAAFNAIGSGYDGKSMEYPSIILQASIWNRALNNEEIKKCFKKEFLEKTNGLVGEWNFSNKDISENTR